MSVEPEYRRIAKKMLDMDKLPQSLEAYLANGSLCSTQTIATLILQWNLNQEIYKPRKYKTPK